MSYKSSWFFTFTRIKFYGSRTFLADLVTIIGTQDLVFVKLIGNFCLGFDIISFNNWLNQIQYLKGN